MNLDISMGQLLTSFLLGSVALNTYFVKKELSGLREDIKEERIARNALELQVREIDARCKERHRAGE